LDEFGALFDIERRDRFAVDQRHDFLRMADRGKNREQAHRRQHGGGKTPAERTDRNLRHRLLFSFSGRMFTGYRAAPA
jgi:hypothetical protein